MSEHSTNNPDYLKMHPNAVLDMDDAHERAVLRDEGETNAMIAFGAAAIKHPLDGYPTNDTVSQDTPRNLRNDMGHQIAAHAVFDKTSQYTQRLGMGHSEAIDMAEAVVRDGLHDDAETWIDIADKAEAGAPVPASKQFLKYVK